MQKVYRRSVMKMASDEERIMEKGHFSGPHIFQDRNQHQEEGSSKAQGHAAHQEENMSFEEVVDRG